MSIRIMSAIWDSDDDLTGAKLLLLLALADNANDEGECWPSLDTLARKTRRDRSHVSRDLSTLEETGYIEVDRTHARRRSNVYRLTRYVAAPATRVAARATGVAVGATEPPSNHQLGEAKASPRTDRWAPSKEWFRLAFGLDASTRTWKMAARVVSVLHANGVEPERGPEMLDAFRDTMLARRKWADYVHAGSMDVALGKWLTDTGALVVTADNDDWKYR